MKRQKYRPHSLPSGKNFKDFSLIILNETGNFLQPGKDLKKWSDSKEITPKELPDFLKRRINLPPKVTDVFVWVHGWQNDVFRASESGRRLFNGIVEVHKKNKHLYPRIRDFIPAFIAVHWPSTSTPGVLGYRRIRNRAKSLTNDGFAEFFLASLLGYLDGENKRAGGVGSKTLQARGGYYVHCIGHSFGGRFLTAAVGAAATPQSPKTLSLLHEVGKGAGKVLSVASESRFAFTVDSLIVFQMAAAARAFGSSLKELLAGPLRGPIVLTFSRHDTATCLWHTAIEGQEGIGCSGAHQPRENISEIALRQLDAPYLESDFKTRIVNVGAAKVFRKGFGVAGAHSDIFYEESIHLILGTANLIR